MAHADGELDVEQTIRLLGSADLTEAEKRLLREHAQVRRACSDCLCPKGQPLAPAELRACIEEAFDSFDRDASGEVGERQRAETTGVLAVIGRWSPAALAAAFLIGSLAVWTTALNTGGGSAGVNPGGLVLAGSGSAAVAHVADAFDPFGGRHVQCSRDTTAMVKNVKLPNRLTELPGALADYFGESFDQTLPMSLDVLGYAFVQAGNCRLPSEGAIHVLYKPVDGSEREGGLSLWISQDPGPVAASLPADRLFSATTSTGKPVFVWRQNGLNYFLVGDETETVRKAAQILSPCAPASK